MSDLKYKLRDVLFYKSLYCGFCFKEIEDGTSCEMQDEVLLDANNGQDMNEILCTVLGKQILEKVASDILCYKCTNMAISSYKFIKMCNDNTTQLHDVLLGLQTYIEKDIKKLEKSKLLFLVTNNSKIEAYYDEKLSMKKGTPLKILQNLLKKSNKRGITGSKLTIDFEYEDCDYGSVSNSMKIDKNALGSILLSDVIHDTSDKNNFKCKTCSKIYPTLWNLKQHYLRVHAPKNVKCPECPRSFGTTLLMERHKKASHCVVVCSQCGKTYTNTYSLKYHERSHNLKLVCHTCGKVYKEKKSFNNHIALKLCQKMRKSNAEATFTCNYCQKKYSKKCSLSIHIQLEHENGKALLCEWCSKRFSSISRLKEHIIKHTKEKNFACEVCGGKFVSKTSLLYHTRTHTGERPYPCELCDMRFLSASRRSDHVRRHHIAPSIECKVCYSKFRGHAGLLQHKKKQCNGRSILFLKSLTNNEKL